MLVYVTTATVVILAHYLVTSSPAWIGTVANWATNSLPNWMQAIGTVGAVFAAIWLATREDRRRVEESVTRAELTAIAVHRRLLTMHLCTKSCTEIMRIVADNSQGVIDHDVFSNAANTMKKLNVMSMEELRDLIVVPDRAAKRIAQAIPGIKSAILHCEAQAGVIFTNKTQRLAALECIGCLVMVPEELKEAHMAVWRYMNAREPIENWVM